MWLTTFVPNPKAISWVVVVVEETGRRRTMHQLSYLTFNDGNGFHKFTLNNSRFAHCWMKCNLALAKNLTLSFEPTLN